MSTSIPALFNSCSNALKSICSRLERSNTSNTESLQLSRWQDELGRLRLWAANIGAHQTKQSSLEFRLKDSSHIRGQVTNLLLDLGQTFQEVEHVLDSLGNGHPCQTEADDSSDDDYDTGEEMTQLHSNIVTAINCLFQMSMLVRKPARHDFYILPQSREVSAFKPFDQAHVREKFPEADQDLVERLGLAITLRRQYLRYRERHHAKLSQGLDIGTEGSAAPTVMLSDTVVTGVELWHTDSQDKKPASVTSQTSYAPSMLAGGALVIPSPPKESSGGAPFECPYCFVMISVDGTPAWHKHVFQDLQPYVCTVAACSTPHTLFSTRHEWVQHMKEAHPHDWTGGEDRARAVIDESDNSSFRAVCPLCRSSSKSERHFVRHLARHLQELALFVLPQDDADSDIDDRPDPELFGKGIPESSDSSTVSTNPENENTHGEQQGHDGQFDRIISAAEIKTQEQRDPEQRGPEQRDLEQIDQEQRERLRAWQEGQGGELDRDKGRPGRLRDSRAEAPYARPPRRRLNEFFVGGARIHREVMQHEICKFLGPEAYSKPHTYNV